MKESNLWPYVIFGIVVFHFIAGIAYLVYKMSSKKTKE